MWWVDERTDGCVIANFVVSIGFHFFLPMVLRCAHESSAYNNCRRDPLEVKMLLLQRCSLRNFHVIKGPNVHDRACVLCMTFILSGSPKECGYIRAAHV